MSDPYFPKVLQLAGITQPLEQPTESDWRAIESDLRLVLPEDLKQLVTQLGHGHFGEFWLFNPRSPSEFTRLSRQTALEFKEDIAPVLKEAGISLYPQDNGFLRIGYANNRMDLLLRPDSPSGSPYQLIWLDEDYYAEGVHKLDTMSISRFLHDFYLGLIPDDWARIDRELVWGPKEPFFLPPGQFDFAKYD
jgi:hypothetical protein